MYVVMGLCRVIFYIYNSDLLPSIATADIPEIIHGSLIFDSASIFYTNLLFIFLSLIPLHFTDKKIWQKILAWVYLITNGAAILLSLTDTFFFPFKLSRLVGDDVHYMGEGNSVSLFFSFLFEYWYAVIFLGGILYLLYFVGFKVFTITRSRKYWVNTMMFYIVQSAILFGAVIISVIAIRGFNVSKASFPITVSDAANYAHPKYSSIIMSNPFAFIRTLGHKISEPTFKVNGEEFRPIIEPTEAPYSITGMNIFIITLESFGTAHIRSIAEESPVSEGDFTPFLDSLFTKGTLFINGYQGGIRSIDAMPSIWSSIPSFTKNFLSYPQSQGSYHALPHILSTIGYSTSFMHGSVSTSMSFKAFGQMTGVNNFVFRDNYEAKYGKGDFDGKWGIWDNKFLPFILEETSNLQEPFLNTIFTLSSHHPYALPSEELKDKYPSGKVPILRPIAFVDDVLKDFFKRASKEDWYENTLFIITADHGSGADNEKWKNYPYSHRVPIFFYTPNGVIPAQRIEKTVSHIDIAPTILAMMDYDMPFFGYGASMFDENRTFAAMGNGDTYSFVEGDTYYQFNNNGLIDVINFKTGESITPNEDKEEFYKSYLKSYFTNLRKKNFSE